MLKINNNIRRLLSPKDNRILQPDPAKLCRKKFARREELPCDIFESSKNAKKQPVLLAKITSHYDIGGFRQLGNMPKDYVKVTNEFIEEHIYTIPIGPNKGKIKITPAHLEEVQEMLPHYHIDKLWTGGKGSGTMAVQNVVSKSLTNPLTQGRVTLDACCIDGKTSPAGFYYKLGFRFKDKDMNNELATWIENGGKRENAPFLTGFMYLPKENIEHCLNYGCL